MRAPSKLKNCSSANVWLLRLLPNEDGMKDPEMPDNSKQTGALYVSDIASVASMWEGESSPTFVQLSRGFRLLSLRLSRCFLSVLTQQFAKHSDSFVHVIFLQ